MKRLVSRPVIGRAWSFLLCLLQHAAFDGGLVSFADDGAAIPAPGLSRASFVWLCGGAPAVLRGLTVENREWLRWHRGVYGVGL